jgi:hypothetical protein
MTSVLDVLRPIRTDDHPCYIYMYYTTAGECGCLLAAQPREAARWLSGGALCAVL